jgi:hypothetical protein
MKEITSPMIVYLELPLVLPSYHHGFLLYIPLIAHNPKYQRCTIAIVFPT